IAILVGVQVVGFGVIARHVAGAHGLLPRSRSLDALLSIVSLERGLMAAIAVGAIGLAGGGWSLWQWALVDFGPLTAPVVMGVLPFCVAPFAFGVHRASWVFRRGVLDLPLRDRNVDEA